MTRVSVNRIHRLVSVHGGTAVEKCRLEYNLYHQTKNKAISAFKNGKSTHEERNVLVR